VLLAGAARQRLVVEHIVLEELAAPVVADVDPRRAVRRREPLEPGADRCEPVLERRRLLF
jgi:hypothetical protein